MSRARLQTRKWTDQAGPGALHHRGGDRPLQRRADHAGQRAAARVAERAKAAGGGYRERAPARAAAAAAARGGGGGGPSWDAPKGGDLDDEIPF